MIDDIRRDITIIEANQNYITQRNVLSIEITAYELTTVMKDYRASQTEPTYNNINDNAMVAFYTDEEREDFKSYLKSKGISFSEESGGRPM
jgi:hypothetical protein